MALNFARHTAYRKLDHDSMVIVLPIDSTLTYSEGLPLYWDATAKVVKPMPASDADHAVNDPIVAAYVGLATQTNPIAHNPKKLTKMAVYIGDVIARLFMHTGEALDHFKKVYLGNEIGVVTVTPVADTTEALGNVVIDVDEYKVARTSFEGEEVSVLLRPSIFKARSF